MIVAESSLDQNFSEVVSFASTSVQALLATILLMLLHITRKAPLETICSECETLQERVDTETNSIVEMLENEFTNSEEKSQELQKALERRTSIVENYLEHLDAHSYARVA